MTLSLTLPVLLVCDVLEHLHANYTLIAYATSSPQLDCKDLYAATPGRSLLEPQKLLAF